MNDDQKLKRREQAARRREIEKSVKEAWKGQVDAYFVYLRTDYHFRVAKMENYWYVTSVLYRSPTTTIKVDRSVEFNQVEVLVGRVISNKAAKNPVSNTLKVSLDHCFLGEILALRAPHLRDDVLSLKGLADEQVENALRFWASTLKEYASDVLQGSFTIFAEIEAKHKNRAT